MGGVQNSLQSILDLMTYVMGIIISNPQVTLFSFWFWLSGISLDWCMYVQFMLCSVICISSVRALKTSLQSVCVVRESEIERDYHYYFGESFGYPEIFRFSGSQFL